MQIRHKGGLKIKLLVASCLLSLSTFAQEADKFKAAPVNMVAVIMISIAVILALVIWGLGNILSTLSNEAYKKSKEKKSAAIITILLSVLSLQGIAQTAPAVEVIHAAPNYGGLDATSFWILVATIFIEIVAILYLLFNIKRMQAELVPGTETEFDIMAWWKKLNNRVFTKAVPVESENTILIDHDYDGIQELDNSLPPWWKYGFYVTILASVFYMFYYHLGGPGKNPTQEYEAEMERAEIVIAKYNAASPNKIDENNIVMPDAAGIAQGEKIYHTSCWPCHGKAGEGTVGPNLTDNFWLHKGSLTDIYKSIKHGYPDKGMPAWDKNYSPSEIADLAGYIKSLAGTNPPGAKLPQGEPFVETAAGADIPADTATK